MGAVRRHFEHLEDHVPTLSEVASALGLSDRTLRRRLKSLATSYSEVLQEVRRDSAEAALIHSDLSVDQIASMLGYSETTNFRHAFRRWVGSSPNAFRHGVMAERGMDLTSRAA